MSLDCLPSIGGFPIPVKALPGADSGFPKPCRKSLLFQPIVDEKEGQERRHHPENKSGRRGEIAVSCNGNEVERHRLRQEEEERTDDQTGHQDARHEDTPEEVRSDVRDMDIEETLIHRQKEQEEQREDDHIAVGGRRDPVMRQDSHERPRDVDIDQDRDEFGTPENESEDQAQAYEEEEEREVSGKVLG